MADTKKLVLRLDPESRRQLEHAAGLCVQRGHFTVEPEHLLRSMVDAPTSPLTLHLEAAGLNADRVAHDLDAALAELQTGNTRTPSLSAHLIGLLQQAWLISSVDYGFSRVPPAAILLACLRSDRHRALLSQSAPSLLEISEEALRKDLLQDQSLRSQQPQAERPSADQADPGADESPTARSGSETSAYCQDLTRLAEQGLIDPVIGRETEIAQLIEILMRRRQNNPILTGEAGVGKTAVVEGFARKVAQRDVPQALAGVRIWMLDLALMQAGASVRGEFESRLKALVGQVKKSAGQIILFIDEAHQLIGSGGPEGLGDAANILKPALARGELRTIAATTWAEYKRHIEKDPALTRRFEVVPVAEPDQARAEQMVLGLVPRLESHHGVLVTPEAVSAAVTLSTRFMIGRQLPDKAISLLDGACARAAIRGMPSVTADLIAERVSDQTGIPLGRLLETRRLVASGLQARLAARLVGQTQALAQIIQQIQASQAGLTSPAKPMAVMMLVGPSGVGKTETAAQLAELLFGGRDQLITLNLSAFQEPHSISGIKGAPAGYVGFGSGGALTEKIRRRPYGLLLLDEAEKAHPDVLELFYQVFDKGLLEDAEGTPINFRNCLVLLTSNVCDEKILSICKAHPQISQEDLLAAVTPDLMQCFPAALLGRMTIVPYRPLGPDEVIEVVRRQLQLLAQRIEDTHQAKLGWSDAVTDWIALQCSEQTGARSAEQILARQLMPYIAAELLDAMASDQLIHGMQLDLEHGQPVVTTQRQPRPSQTS
ncbi:MAG: AAA family ATPase [Burkholderiaceae bacterium]